MVCKMLTKICIWAQTLLCFLYAIVITDVYETQIVYGRPLGLIYLITRTGINNICILTILIKYTWIKDNIAYKKALISPFKISKPEQQLICWLSLEIVISFQKYISSVFGLIPQLISS